MKFVCGERHRFLSVRALGVIVFAAEAHVPIVDIDQPMIKISSSLGESIT